MAVARVLDVSALAGVVTGRVVVPGDVDYDVSRAGFNGID